MRGLNRKQWNVYRKSLLFLIAFYLCWRYLGSVDSITESKKLASLSIPVQVAFLHQNLTNLLHYKYKTGLSVDLGVFCLFVFKWSKISDTDFRCENLNLMFCSHRNSFCLVPFPGDQFVPILKTAMCFFLGVWSECCLSGKWVKATGIQANPKQQCLLLPCSWVLSSFVAHLRTAYERPRKLMAEEIEYFN